MTTLTNAMTVLTAELGYEEAWAYKLTREELLEYNAMIAELGYEEIEKACEWLVDEWEDETEIEEVGYMSMGEAWEYKLTKEEWELSNSHVAEQPLPATMTVAEALASCDWEDDISDKGNVILPFMWEPEVKVLRVCALEDLSSCMNVVKIAKEVVQV